MLHICDNVSTVTAVERFFKYEEHGTQVVMVDVISNNGSMWIKIFARKRKALHKKWLGKNFREKLIRTFFR